MYYCCGWEQIVNRSENTQDNIKLMKLIVLSIELNSTPFNLTGLKYFRVTLSTVLKVNFKSTYVIYTFFNVGLLGFTGCIFVFCIPYFDGLKTLRLVVK